MSQLYVDQYSHIKVASSVNCILFYQPINLAISGQVQKAQLAKTGAQLCHLEPLVESVVTLHLAPDTTLGNSNYFKQHIKVTLLCFRLNLRKVIDPIFASSN